MQYAARKIGLDWAAKTAKDNAWFGKVFKSQPEFEVLWKGADHWRKVKVKES